MKDNRLIALFKLLHAMKHHPEWSPEKIVKVSVWKCKRYIRRHGDLLEAIKWPCDYEEFMKRKSGLANVPSEYYHNHRADTFRGMRDKESLSMEVTESMMIQYLVKPIKKSISQPAK